MLHRIVVCFGLFLFQSAVAPGVESRGLVEIRAHAGIDFVNVSGDSDKALILSSLGGGAALFDYDGDGDLDLYFLNGVKLVGGFRVAAGGNRLFRNEGGWRFREATDEAGVGGEAWSIGCAVGDYDNDGLADLYVTNIGSNVLYRNRGDGTFVGVTEPAGAGDQGFGTSAAFFDADGDGDLDLYASNYVNPDLKKIPPPGAEPTCLWLGMAVMCGPRGLEAQSDVFYRNEGGAFVESTRESGLGDVTPAYGLGVVSADYDDDGDADLYVANDTHPNFLFRNQGNGRFQEVGLLAGAAYNAFGKAEAGMGVDFGDADGDGDLDIFVTNFSHETNTLYLNSGLGFFTDATEEAGLAHPSLGRLGWGVRFADLDNDGDEDLFVANGHVYPNVSKVDATTSYRQENQVFLNLGEGRFAEGTLSTGDETETASSRGAAFGDVDNDGDTDIVVVNIDEAPNLLRNDLPEGAHWVGLTLVGRLSNRDAFGARVRVRTSERTQVKELRSSGSIFSASDARLLFGLGASEAVEEIWIRWPSGQETRLENLRRDRYIVLIEGLDEP